MTAARQSSSLPPQGGAPPSLGHSQNWENKGQIIGENKMTKEVEKYQLGPKLTNDPRMCKEIDPE